MIMAMVEDRMVGGSIIWNIYTTLVGEDAHFNLPVGKVGMEWERDILIH